MADRDYDLAAKFDADRLFELPPNELDPNGYNFPIAGPVETVTAAECDFLRDHEPVVVASAYGRRRAYSWAQLKSHSVSDLFGDTPVTVFF
jgi:hypothetical protein